MLRGIPNDYVGVGTVRDLACTAERIKPEAADIYWMIGDQRENGSLWASQTNSDGTLIQFNTLSYRYYSRWGVEGVDSLRGR